MQCCIERKESKKDPRDVGYNNWPVALRLEITVYCPNGAVNPSN